MGGNEDVAPRSVQQLTVALLGGVVVVSLVLGALGLASTGVTAIGAAALVVAVVVGGVAGLYAPAVLESFETGP